MGSVLVSLAVLMSMTEEPELAWPSVGGWPAFLPFLAISRRCLGLLHLGPVARMSSRALTLWQQRRWATCNLVLALILVYPRLDFLALREGPIWPCSFFFGGLCPVLPWNLK